MVRGHLKFPVLVLLVRLLANSHSPSACCGIISYRGRQYLCSTVYPSRFCHRSVRDPMIVPSVTSALDGRGNSYNTAATVGLDEREKELIRMKMERLDAAKTIVDREHALHSGTAGAPGASGGGGAGGGSAGGGR